ncbi:MAG: LLM class F420-dependent oxidoreductase [Acidimicrobiales bacterium]
MQLGAMFGGVSMGRDFATISEAARALEAAGFDSISTNDHVVGAHPDRSDGVKMNTYTTAVHEPIVLLSMLAAVTSRIELATSIIIAPQRQTVLLAKQVAELDLLSNGRVRLGLGIGRNWIEYEALNEEFGTRGRRLEEQIEVLRLLWRDELVTFEGRWHTLDRVGINPRPLRESIPIWLGAYVNSVSERVLERIGRLADGWMPQYPPDVLAPAIESVRRSAETAGRRFEDIDMECVVTASPGDSSDQWLELAGAYRELGATHLKVAPGYVADQTPRDRVDLMLRWHETVHPAFGS